MEFWQNEKIVKNEKDLKIFRQKKKDLGADFGVIQHDITLEKIANLVILKEN